MVHLDHFRAKFWHPWVYIIIGGGNAKFGSIKICELNTPPDRPHYKLSEKLIISNWAAVRVENFEGGKFRAIQDFALFRKFRGY